MGMTPVLLPVCAREPAFHRLSLLKQEASRRHMKASTDRASEISATLHEIRLPGDGEMEVRLLAPGPASQRIPLPYRLNISL